MEVIIRPDKESACQLACDLIFDAIALDPKIVLGLATGGTMENLYARLSKKINLAGLNLDTVRTFNLDEYIGLSPTHSGSYRSYMEKHFFSQVSIKTQNTFLPRGDALDVEQECLDYEKLIKKAGGIDLQLLGLGQIGHIGFNEPLSSLASRTRAKSLTPETRKQNAQYFGGEANVPKRAITVGVGTILESTRALMLVTGRSKAEILAKSVEGPVTSLISATALQLHPKCMVIVDEAAAAKLVNQEYYRWVFENEPEWERYR